MKILTLLVLLALTSCATTVYIPKPEPVVTLDECLRRSYAPIMGDDEIKNVCVYEVKRNIWVCECNGMAYKKSEMGFIIRGEG